MQFWNNEIQGYELFTGVEQELRKICDLYEFYFHNVTLNVKCGVG